MRLQKITVLCTVGFTVWVSVATGATTGATTFTGPSAYTSVADTPAGFICGAASGCAAILEDFEDGSLDHGLVIDATNGEILDANVGNALEGYADSVDADDGTIDGFGNTGHSYFSPGNMTKIHFPEVVKAAGVVWTDGDRTTVTMFEAFGPNGSLGVIGPFSLADGVFRGTTGEDSFFGVQDPDGITSIALMNFGGSGIEIDHIQFASSVPEPSSLLLFVMAAISATGRLRRSRQ